jgi:succinyl-CoA synthetase beta subunit
VRLLEYQGKALFKNYGIPVGNGVFVTSPEEALRKAETVGFPIIAKTQVYSGGRGKLGGVAICATKEELKKSADHIFTLSINNECSKGILLENALQIKEEFYLGITIDPSLGVPTVIFSSRGGVDIEEVAQTIPEAVGKMPLPVLTPCRKHELALFFKKYGVPSKWLKSIVEIASSLSRLFFQEDATTAEINPLALLNTEDWVAVDSKIVIDDSALYRQPEIPLESITLSPLEERAAKINVAFVPLSGEIAVIAGGAGLAMGTMDLVSHFGSSPSSFLDTGGGISSEAMAESLRISLSHPGVKGVIINVFGGINDCAVMGRGLSKVIDEDRPNIPIVVKMRGHSQEEGWALLEERDIPIVKYGTSEDAVRMLIEITSRC